MLHHLKGIDVSQDLYRQFKTSTNTIATIDRKTTQKRIASMMKENNSFIDSTPHQLLNQAIKNKLPIPNIEELLHQLLTLTDNADFLERGTGPPTIERMDVESVLDHIDEFGWTTLHYACRFMPDNDSFIKILLDESPSAADIPDRFNRYPLHLACCSQETSLKTIDQLLEKGKGVVQKPNLHTKVSLCKILQDIQCYSISYFSQNFCDAVVTSSFSLRKRAVQRNNICTSSRRRG
jgi:hypothetical protein